MARWCAILKKYWARKSNGGGRPISTMAISSQKAILGITVQTSRMGTSDTPRQAAVHRSSGPQGLY